MEFYWFVSVNSWPTVAIQSKMQIANLFTSLILTCLVVEGNAINFFKKITLIELWSICVKESRNSVHAGSLANPKMEMWPLFTMHHTTHCSRLPNTSVPDRTSLPEMRNEIASSANGLERSLVVVRDFDPTHNFDYFIIFICKWNSGGSVTVDHQGAKHRQVEVVDR